MADIEVLRYSDEETHKLLENLFLTERLIPFIGSGFSKDSSNKNRGKVPDGGQLKKIMYEALVKHNSDKVKLITDATEFSRVAKYYLKHIPRTEQLQMFAQHFMGVTLDAERTEFLNKGWPYLYTLNIDDAIENALKDYQLVLPYKKLNKAYLKTTRCIFKLHGDAKYEVVYPGEKNLVFSQDQYLMSLRDNIDLLSQVQADYKTKSILILGCSLDDEIDLKYAVITNDGFDESQNHRFFLTDKMPDDDQMDKLEDIAVNKIILVDDYSSFYKTFLASQKRTENSLAEYRFQGYTENGEKDANINYILGLVKQENGGKVVKYKTMAERDIETEHISAIMKNDTILAIGPRLSGKTTFLVNIMRYLAPQPVYFFTSVITVSTDFLHDICSLTNSVLVFDSNAISPDNTKEFIKIFNSIRQNGNKLIVAANKSDKLFMAFYTNLSFSKRIEIDKRPTEAERERINALTNPFAIPMFRENKSFIDNIAWLSSGIFKERKNVFPEIEESPIDEIELILLILLASVGKVYYITLQYFGISVSQMERIVKKYEPVIELYDSDLIEVHMHSGLKVVANSKYWVITYLSSLVKTQHIMISNAVEQIVKSLYFTANSSYCAKQVILFDNLNAIFSSNDGVALLPYEIYEKLQPYLNNEPDYWLQRAKSVRILSHKIDELQSAKEYAYKAYLDFETNEQYSEKAVLTIAMIAGKICKLDGYKNMEWVSDAIDWYYQALTSEKNIAYSDSLLERARREKKRNDLFCFVNYLTLHQNDFGKQRQKVSDIVSQVLNYNMH